MSSSSRRPSTARDAGPLRIVVVSCFYSEGMGYGENCLPRALAALGHEVHLVTSTYNVYANSPDYEATYEAFLGPRVVAPGTFEVGGYRVHRLPAKTWGRYVSIGGLPSKMRELGPDIVHSLEIASLPTFALAAARPFLGYHLFCETHQHMSVVWPFLRQKGGAPLRRAAYGLTRTLPSHLASRAVDRVYAIAPDCLEVAERFYGVPRDKLVLRSLGADTALFHPPIDDADHARRAELRRGLGFAEDEVVCVYSGRFSNDKNPLVLARAIDALQGRGARFRGLFIGDGEQRAEIEACRGTVVLPFMNYHNLADHYRAADVGVWPTQESMSMLDAAACGLPLVVSDRIGEKDRVTGNGVMYVEGDQTSLETALSQLERADVRRSLGETGRRKMVEGFNWASYARAMETDYRAALAGELSASPRASGAA